MRVATLYSAEQKKVTVYSGYIPYHVRGPIRALNSPDIFEKDEISHVHHLPVERWVFDGKEFFIALDPVLREIVESKVETRAVELTVRHRRMIEKQDEEILRLHNRTLWDIIVFKLKKRWVK